MVEVAANHPLQPAPELGRMAVQVAQKARFDGLRRSPQTLCHRHATHGEVHRIGDFPQKCVKPRKLKVSGLPWPRRFRRSAAW
jgi:hypothetical protein